MSFLFNKMIDFLNISLGFLYVIAVLVFSIYKEPNNRILYFGMLMAVIIITGLVFLNN
jgi:hypothetical protein